MATLPKVTWFDFFVELYKCIFLYYREHRNSKGQWWSLWTLYTVYLKNNWFVQLENYMIKKTIYNPTIQQLLDTEDIKSQTICLLPNGFNPVVGLAWMTQHLSPTEGHVGRLNRDRCRFFNPWCLSSTILGRLNAVTPLTIMTARPRAHSLCSAEPVYVSLITHSMLSSGSFHSSPGPSELEKLFKKIIF